MTIQSGCSGQDCRNTVCPAMRTFSCLTAIQHAALCREKLARYYPTGQVVIHSHTPALGILAVRSGLVTLTRPGSHGNGVVVGLRKPGELLGVREVLSGTPHQISAETLEPSVLCAIPREAFLEAVRGCPELAMRILEQVARDSLSTEEQLATRTQACVAARTARLLVALADGGGCDAGRPACPKVSLSRERLALLVGTARETLSRSLGRFAEQGAVRLDNGTIEILDHSMLERAAEA